MHADWQEANWHALSHPHRFIASHRRVAGRAGHARVGLHVHGPVRAGSGNYLTSSGTDNLRQVSGSVKFSQTVPGAPISASGSLSGLQPNTGYVTVPYKDGACIPAAGVTAFPSAPFYTNATGAVTFSGVTVNPAAINPLGSFNVNQTASVSVRQLVVSSVTIPGVISTPNVPNVGAVEACDRVPVTSS